MADTDLYETLGISRNASDKEVRDAYRKLARKWHPDVNAENPDAEEKFKSISAAHDVLSNPEKRKLYDEFGAEGLRGGFNAEQARAYRRYGGGARGAQGGGFDPSGGIPFDFDLSDLFGDAFRGAGAGRGRATKGQDLLARVELDFAEALRGKEVELDVPRFERCGSCRGTGTRAGGAEETCGVCHGSGRSQALGGSMRVMATCQACGGAGKRTPPCPTCGGAGRVQTHGTTKLRIPKGADDGSELRVRGRGEPGRHGGPPGDLVIQTRVRPHPHFKRDGLDLELRLPITLAEAYNGATVQVPTPAGSVDMKVPPRSQSGQRLRLKGKGVARDKKAGDLYVELQVRTPKVADETLSKALADADALYGDDVRADIGL